MPRTTHYLSHAQHTRHLASNFLGRPLSRCENHHRETMRTMSRATRPQDLVEYTCTHTTIQRPSPSSSHDALGPKQTPLDCLKRLDPSILDNCCSPTIAASSRTTLAYSYLHRVVSLPAPAHMYPLGEGRSFCSPNEREHHRHGYRRSRLKHEGRGEGDDDERSILVEDTRPAFVQQRQTNHVVLPRPKKRCIIYPQHDRTKLKAV